MARVVNGFVDKAQRRQLIIGGPLVLPDRCSRSDDALDDWNQRRRIPLLNELDVALLRICQTPSAVWHAVGGHCDILP